MVNIEQEISSDLFPGERIAWSGRPRQGIYLKPSDLFVIPFSLMWGGFAFFWEFAVSTQLPKNSPQPFFSLWGIPFCLVGVYLIVGRFFYDAYSRKSSCYAITDKRVLIRKALFGGRKELVALELAHLPQLT